MAAAKDGGAAFPGDGWRGMTLREYVAAGAVQGLLAHGWYHPNSECEDYHAAGVAGVAVALADALLAALGSEG